MLFDRKERTAQDIQSYKETDWDYLDRSGRIEAQRVRDFLNSWISEYPESDRGELISRFRSRDSRDFQSATFELFLFALLRSLGCSVAVHPNLENGCSKHPDFLVITPTGEPVYVEAVLASEYSAADVAARKRTDVVLHAIEQIDSPNFFVGVDPDGHPERPPSGKRLRKELERWLASLDPDVVSQDIARLGADAIPTMKWQHDDWSITFEAIPKKPEKRGQGQRIIGMLSGKARWVNTWEPIRDSVKTKGNRYGELSHPLLVAINVDTPIVDRHDEMQGLYGEEEYVFRVGDPSAQGQMRRRPNGAWVGENRPQYTRVSGAWIFVNLDPWNMVSRKNTVYFNPWASKPLPPLFDSVNHAKGVDGEMQWNDGRPLSEILGIPTEWPG